jgi:hypothetical protein
VGATSVARRQFATDVLYSGLRRVNPMQGGADHRQPPGRGVDKLLNLTMILDLTSEAFDQRVFDRQSSDAVARNELEDLVRSIPRSGKPTTSTVPPARRSETRCAAGQRDLLIARESSVVTSRAHRLRFLDSPLERGVRRAAATTLGVGAAQGGGKIGRLD